MSAFRKTTAALACTVVLLSCRPSARDESANDAASTPPAAQPPVPLAEAPRDRASLMIALARAASAAALGIDDRATQRSLDGDRFEFRLRFGCPRAGGESQAGGPFSARFDQDSATLRLSVTPTASAEDPAVAAIAGENVEAVEGFWIERPWLLAAGCPAVPGPTGPAADPAASQPPAEPGGEAPTAAIPRAAIVQFHTANDPRTERRGERPYAATKTLPEGAQPSANGYDLVLSGRLRALPDGRVIACTATSPNLPPTCLVSAVFGRVWMERPGTGELIAEWGRH